MTRQLTVTLGTFLKGMLDTFSDGAVIDIENMLLTLKYRILLRTMKDTEKGAFYPLGVELDMDVINAPCFLLNTKNSHSENRVILALLFAEYLLSLKKESKKVYTCDMFFLRELRQYRISRQLFLATRLVMPESVIDDLDKMKLQANSYAKQAELLPAFINCAYPQKDVGGILGLLDSLDTGFTLGRKIGASQNKVQSFLPQIDASMLSSQATPT